LSKDFVKLVLLSNLVAAPVAYFAMNKWLQSFAYRIEISWWVLALAGGMALLIALLTVSVQAIRAALANPVEALRYE
jgi:putative ABC transport system permease protein